MNDQPQPAPNEEPTTTPATPPAPTPDLPTPPPAADPAPAPITPPVVPSTPTPQPGSSTSPAPVSPPAAAPAPETPAVAVAPPPPQPQPTASESDGTLTRTANAFYGFFATIFSWVIFPIIVVLILHNFVFQAYHVVGTSMFPTLHDSDYLIVSKIGSTEALIKRLFNHSSEYIPGRGDIIVFHFPRDPTQVFVKRVIGLPGDRVVVKNGKVTVYPKATPNTPISPDTKYETASTVTLIDTDDVVQPGNVFVMGDNRTPGGSYDSREWGELPASYIIGQADLRLLPLSSAKIL